MCHCLRSAAARRPTRERRIKDGFRRRFENWCVCRVRDSPLSQIEIQFLMILPGVLLEARVKLCLALSTNLANRSTKILRSLYLTVLYLKRKKQRVCPSSSWRSRKAQVRALDIHRLPGASVRYCLVKVSRRKKQREKSAEWRVS